ncbi:tetratricopeptide repeat protein [Planctomyces sp. SH-PL62]|uniref:tetratricopeptide repeat protein n=1 Tax=Planctomyces sp. SH-PL62 TaxID=1636152 RepID=UPI00078C7FF3|nr:tetratricopeptide repeat protein [Planctomyces sp. SH-PL62]AMV35905.1 TPR repeat-containing protein YrrB [Planctomyces sp. SH-PL62]
MTVKNPPLALAVCLVLAGWSRVAASTNDLRAEALTLYQAGRFVEALPRFDAVLERHPNDLEALVKRGNAYLRLDRPSKALSDFERVIQRDPLNTSGHTDRAVALMMLGRLDESEAAFVRSIRLREVPLNGARGLGGGGRDAVQEARATAYAGLAQVHHRLNRDDEALAEYDQAIRIYPSDPNSHIGRGDVHRALGDFPRALADLDEAVRLGPGYPRAFASRGRLLEDLKQDDRAEADYARAIEIDPSYTFAHRLRGGLRSRLGRNEEALEDFEIVARLRPNDAETLKDRGGVLVRMGKFEEALAELDRAIQIDPKNARAYQNRGAAYNSLARYEDAVADLDRAIALDPKNAGARTNCGLAYFMLGDFERSLEDLGEAVKLAPRNAIVHFNRGNVYAKLGLREQALADYQAVEEADPKLLASYGGAHKVFAEMSRERMAVRTPAPRPAPSSEADLRLAEGRSLQAAGDWTRAIAAYDRAIAADPRRGESYIARGWSRLCADVDGAETDARAYLNLEGWSDPASAYMAMLGVLAERRAGRDQAAYAVLEEALAKLPQRDAWPRPALLHLNGDLADADLVDRAGNDVQRAEAHTLVALDLLRKHKTTEAREHLEWVRAHSVDRSVASDLALATLARLDRTEQVARKP